MTAIQRKKLLFNFSSLSVIQASNFLLSIVVIPFVIRKIGADGFGVVSVAQVVMIYLSILVEYGFNQTATRDIAIYRNDPDKSRISSIYSTVLMTKIVVCVFSFVILLGLLLAVPIFYEHFYLYLIAFSFVLGQTLLINWFFMGMEKMQYVAVPSLAGRIIFVILVFVFIKEKNDSALFLFFMGTGNIIAGLLSIYFAFKIYRLRFVTPTWKEIGGELKKGWPITVTNFYITTCQYAGIFILRIFTDDLVVGYYSVAEKIFFAMKAMVGIFTQVAFPQVCQLIQKGKRQVMFFFRRIYVPFFLIVVFGTALIFVFSPQIIYLLIGENYIYGSFLLRMFCIAVIIVTLNIPPYLMLLADDHRKSYLKVFTVGTIINLTANILLAKYFSATGTVVAVIITETFITAGLYSEMIRIFYPGKTHKAVVDSKSL